MNGIPMNPPRTIRRITPQITSLESGTGIGQNSNVGWNRSDRILPRNIGIFGVFGFFDRGESDLFNRSASWHCASKIESESLGGNRIFENSERDNNFEVEKVRHKNSVILNQVNSNHINTNSNHSNHVN